MTPMTEAEQHTRVTKLLSKLPDGAYFHEVLGLSECKAPKAGYTGSSAVPNNRRTAPKRRGNE